MKNRLWTVINDKNVRIVDICNALDISYSIFYKYMREEVEPKVSRAIEIAGYLGVSVEEIWYI